MHGAEIACAAQTLALFAFTKRHTHALVLLIDERVSAYMQPDAATPTQKAGAAGWPPIASVLVGVLVVVITSLGPRYILYVRDQPKFCYCPALRQYALTGSLGRFSPCSSS